jgi:uncharacterized damage-inducible protein DinB
MTQISLFQKELEREAIATRKMLSAVPEGKWDWKPHPRSMNMLQLTTHVAELPLWIGMALNTNELDFAGMDFKPTPVKDTAALVKIFETSLDDAREQLAKGKEDTLDQLWTLRNGEQVYSKEPKADVIRMSLSQIIHHRAQLGVFLRLLDVPIPGSYGPSADDPSF